LMVHSGLPHSRIEGQVEVCNPEQDGLLNMWSGKR